MTNILMALNNDLNDKLNRYKEIMEELENQTKIIRSYTKYEDMLTLAPDRLKRIQELEAERLAVFEAIQDIKRYIMGLN